MSLLEEQGGRAQIFFAADFEPQVGCVHRLSQISETHAKKLPKEGAWRASALQYSYVYEPAHFLLSLDYRRIACQAFGLKYWIENAESNADLFISMLQGYGITSLNRVGLKIRVWLDLKMSFEELRQLFFGTFLLPLNSIAVPLGTIEDHSLQFDGDRNGFRFVFVTSPMTAEHVATSFKSTQNLSSLVVDPLLDTSLVEFLDRLSQDSLYLDIDLFQTKLSPADVRRFLRDGYSNIRDMIENATNFLKSLPQ